MNVRGSVAGRVCFTECAVVSLERTRQFGPSSDRIWPCDPRQATSVHWLVIFKSVKQTNDKVGLSLVTYVPLWWGMLLVGEVVRVWGRGTWAISTFHSVLL